MIETAVLILGLICPTPDLPADHEVASVLQTGWPSETVYGASPYEFPTAPKDGSNLTFKITVDPLYEDYAVCFIEQVRRTLGDDRSWDNVREAATGETPNVWIILTPPGGACAKPDLPRGSCAAGAEGTGQIWLNSLRWFSGYKSLGLLDSRRQMVNHEVGHMLGLGHQNCSVMGYPQWMPGDGPPWAEWDDCLGMAWPTTADLEEAMSSG